MLLKHNNVIEMEVEVLYLKHRELQTFIFNAVPYTEYIKIDLKNNCKISIKVYDNSNVEIFIKTSCEFTEDYLNYLSMEFEHINKQEFETKLKEYEKNFKN